MLKPITKYSPSHDITLNIHMSTRLFPKKPTFECHSQ